ncbi:glucosaminidase domain-containing protein [Flammeovirgaceae bacterium SG7u.111]|nr:glucosaminidase domain-containing protein [Flammeovirgaceae bacterium SG7u.132]WPO34275.1 glucosaminidase domain-containing protein [Flammeovirgaceae bacterium SG7u.111]
MKEARFTLPIKYKGDSVSVGINSWNPFLHIKGQNIFFILDRRILLAILALMVVILFKGSFSKEPSAIYHYYNFGEGMDKISIPVKSNEPQINDELLDILPDLEEELELETDPGNDNIRQAFLREKHKITYKYIVGNNVARADLLDDYSLKEMNEQISRLFVNMILDKIPMEDHVYQYFTDTADLKKIETCLMEQAKFNIPASIKLSQSALETSYGRRILNNNYFGIKDKSGKTRRKTTTEYYTAAELKRNKDKVVSQKLVKKNGKTFYKCTVRDHFQEYITPWQSFRAHSTYLRNNNRYHKLFSRGKDFNEWADTIGSTKMGGVGYATSPIYGKILKSIIKRYHLDLLDY